MYCRSNKGDFHRNIDIDSCGDMSPRNWMRCDVVICECSLDETNSHQLKLRTTHEREKKGTTSHTAEWHIQRGEENATLVRIQCGGGIFSFYLVIYPLVLENVFVYDQRYLVEISAVTGFIDHADSEYVVLFFSRTHFRTSSR